VLSVTEGRIVARVLPKPVCHRRAPANLWVVSKLSLQTLSYRGHIRAGLPHLHRDTRDAEAGSSSYCVGLQHRTQVSIEALHKAIPCVPMTKFRAPTGTVDILKQILMDRSKSVQRSDLAILGRGIPIARPATAAD
jgi:hypothetical protein